MVNIDDQKYKNTKNFKNCIKFNRIIENTGLDLMVYVSNFLYLLDSNFFLSSLPRELSTVNMFLRFVIITPILKMI